MDIKKSKWLSLFVIASIYIFAFGIGLTVYNLHNFKPFLNLLVADIIATIVVFIFSLIFKNASVYDPYWSVQPIFIGVAFMVKYGYSLMGLILLIAVCVWGIRLTINWLQEFHDFSYQDWRYIHLKEKTGKFYPIINFIGIHLVPTLVVYACVLPLVYTIIYKPKFNYFSMIFVAVCIGAVVLQTISDIQMRNYRKNRTTNFIRTGLWKYCRHPNYLGEISMWWGIGLATIITMPSMWPLILGAFINTLLFLFVSIPMQDGRQSKKKGFELYKKQTRSLLPIYKKQ